MKTLYLECNMGAAGDMLTAALLELVPDREKFLQKMNALGLPGVRVECESVQKCGISGTHIRVKVHGEEEISDDVFSGHSHKQEHGHTEDWEHPHIHTLGHTDGHHEHRTGHTDSDHSHSSGHRDEETSPIHSHTHHHFSLTDIQTLVTGLNLSEAVKADALAVYALIAEAESHAHGVPIEEVHFHEVGSMDAVSDIVGCCLLFHQLDAQEIIVSPIHVGSGSVRCAHGILPVPAPATAYILHGVPIYGGDICGELCTPTGAALLRHFATRFGSMPPISIEQIGYGMGSKDFERANCVRAFLGESDHTQDEIYELCCNLDDMTPEAVGCAYDRLFEGGALDVFVSPIQMKKNRPALLLTCLCLPKDKDTLIKLLLLHTSTLGVRERNCHRSILQSSFFTVETEYGSIRIKKSAGYGIQKSKPEYSDVQTAALAHHLPFETVWRKALIAAESSGL